MPKSKNLDKIVDDMRNAAWCIEGLSELFMNLVGDKDIDISASGLYGVGLILDGIHKKIDSSTDSLEAFNNRALMGKHKT